MQTSDRLVVAVDKNLKKKFLDFANAKGQTASYIIRKFLTDSTKKGKPSGKKRGRPAKTITQ